MKEPLGSERGMHANKANKGCNGLLIVSETVNHSNNVMIKSWITKNNQILRGEDGFWELHDRKGPIKRTDYILPVRWVL